MSDEKDSVRGQRGIALVVALLVLVFLSLLASALMMNINVETQIAGRGVRTDQALNIAEAGVSEAMERIRKGDIPDNSNPKMVAMIFLAQPGSIPVVGTDTVALATWQEASKWLNYSAPTRGPDVLTVTYKTDAARTVIYRYDSTKNPAIQTASGTPIFVVNSTGKYGDATRSIVTETIEDPIKSNGKGAIVAKKKIHQAHKNWLCGYNHQVGTPEWIDVPKGRDGSSNACNDDLPKKLWELGANDLVGAWCGGKIDGISKGGFYGSPSGYLQNQSGFYNGAWDVFGMSQNQFFAMLGPPRTQKKYSGDLNGIIYIDPKPKEKNKEHVEIKSGDGEGLLYVDCDELTIKNNFTYHGLIYSTGKIVFEGKSWVIGMVVSEREVHVHSHDGDTAILYSKDAIEQNLGKYTAPFITLSWREKQ